MVDMNNTNQVSYMTESCQILSDTLNMIESYVEPGQSVIELDKLAEEYILSRDAEPAFKDIIIFLLQSLYLLMTK